MAKGIIMVDMPEDDCRECIFCWEVKNTGNLECAARILQDVTDGRPGWCPIKPVPDKRHRTDMYGTITTIERIYQTGYNEGYDKCMDDILGGYGDGKKEMPDKE